MAYADTKFENNGSVLNTEPLAMHPSSLYEKEYWSLQHPSKRPISYVAETGNAGNLSDASTTNQDEKPEGYWANKYTSKKMTSSSFVELISGQRGNIGNAGGSFVEQVGGRKRKLEELEVDPNGKEIAEREVAGVARSREIEQNPYKRREIAKAQIKAVEFVRSGEEVMAQRQDAARIVEETIKQIIHEKELERLGILPPSRGRSVSPALQ